MWFFIFTNFLLHSWMIIKFWLYAYMYMYIADECTILWLWFWRHRCLIFLCFYALFSKISFRFSWFSNLVVEEPIIEKALNANECVRWIEALIANLGHPLWGSQLMLDLASVMRKGRTFLIPDANSWLTVSPIKDDSDLPWMPIFISHTHLYVVFSLWRALQPHKIWKSPKSETNFWKECIKVKQWRTPVPPKLYP